MEKLFNNNSSVFWAFNATILLVDEASNATILLADEANEVEMGLITKVVFSMVFRIIFKHFKDPISKDTTLLMIDRLELLH